ncbi:type I restriction enzyme HsdR N-terminal domain-containing protein [Flavobacterium branchiophilum]
MGYPNTDFFNKKTKLQQTSIQALYNSYIFIYFCAMQELNFPVFEFRFKKIANKTAIFDEIRKKFIILTPEEWVRQHVVQYLIQVLRYPKSLINVEKVLKINNLTKRYDVVVFQKDGSIFLLVECKAPQIKISQDTFDQIARYNLTLKAQYLMVSNGLNHYFCSLDFDAEAYTFLSQLPLMNQPN